MTITDINDMTLRQAIKKTRIITASIHVDDGGSHQIRLSKKDALEACSEYLDSTFGDGISIENQDGSIIAILYEREQFGGINRLSIGR